MSWNRHLAMLFFAKQNQTADSLRNHKEAKSRTEAWHLCLLFVPILRVKSQRWTVFLSLSRWPPSCLFSDLKPCVYRLGLYHWAKSPNPSPFLLLHLKLQEEWNISGPSHFHQMRPSTHEGKTALLISNWQLSYLSTPDHLARPELSSERGWWVGPHPCQDCLVMHSSCPLFKPKPLSGPPKGGLNHTGSSHLFIFLMWPYWINPIKFLLLPISLADMSGRDRQV